MSTTTKKRVSIKEKSELDVLKAQEIIAKERQERVQEFIEKLKQLCKEYKVTLSSGEIVVTAL